MTRKLGVYTIFIVFFCSPVLGQDFSNDPELAIDQSAELAQEALSNPLIFEGLSSFVFRYNRARVGLAPAGYETEDWLYNRFSEISGQVSEKVSSLSEVNPLTGEDKSEMIEAFRENSENFYSFYSNIQEEIAFQEVSADQMLYYLSAYAFVANTANTGLWENLSSITGVWPLCFWEG